MIDPSLDMTAYRDHSAIAASDLKLLLQKSPYHFARRHELPKAESASLSIGTAMHYAILEPQHYEKHKAIEPNHRRNTRAYKDWKEAQTEESIIVPPDFEESVQAIRQRLLETGLSDLFGQGQAEVSIFTEVQACNLKCRPDWLDIENRRIIDLKTSRDLKWFGYDAKKFWYPLSAVHYKECIAAETKTQPDDWTYIFLVVESQAPFDTNWYILKEETQAAARAQWQEGIDLVQNCAASGRWPGFCADEPTEI